MGQGSYTTGGCTRFSSSATNNFALPESVDGFWTQGWRGCGANDVVPGNIFFAHFPPCHSLRTLEMLFGQKLTAMDGSVCPFPLPGSASVAFVVPLLIALLSISLLYLFISRYFSIPQPPVCSLRNLQSNKFISGNQWGCLTATSSAWLVEILMDPPPRVCLPVEQASGFFPSA